MPSTFTIAFPPGVTVGKWTRAFTERHPDVELRVIRMRESDQPDILRSGAADMAFVREPVDAEGLHLIPLYAEDMVVAMNHEHLLTLEKKLRASDLAEETILASEPDEALMRSVAAADGVAVMPQSVAKALRRKDVVSMRLDDAEQSRVGLAWPREDQHPLVDEFIGIVRGRTAHSSRNPEVAAREAASAAAPQKREPATGKGSSQRPTGQRRTSQRSSQQRPGRSRRRGR